MQVKRKQIALDVAQGVKILRVRLFNKSYVNKNVLWGKQAGIPVQTYLIIAVRELFYFIPLSVSFMSSADLKSCYLLLIFKVSFSDMHYILYAFASATPAK